MRSPLMQHVGVKIDALHIPGLVLLKFNVCLPVAVIFTAAFQLSILYSIAGRPRLFSQTQTYCSLWTAMIVCSSSRLETFWSSWAWRLGEK